MPKRRFVYSGYRGSKVKRVGTRAKRRLGFKRPRITRSKRSFSKRNLHHFKRYAGPATFQIAAPLSEYDGAFVITFAGITNYTEFTPLYDRYMITGVLYKFQLISNPDANYDPAGTNNTTTTFYPKLWWCKDYDDSGAEALSSLYQRAGTKCRVLKPNQELKIYVKPAVLAQTYATATTTGYAPKWNQWIDMDNTAVPHYGLKWVFDCNGIATATGHPWYLRLETLVYFKCKDVR